MSAPWIAASIALWAVVVLLGLIVLGTLRRITIVLERAESHLRTSPEGAGPGGLESGTKLPDFEGITLEGSPFTRDHVLGTPAVLVLLSRNCPACRALEKDLAERDLFGLEARVIAVVGEHADAERLATVTGLEVVLQRDRSIARAFSSSATPHAFAIDASGVVIRSGTPNTFDALARLISEAEGGDRTLETEARVLA
jgi:hypothetical protein